MEKRLNQKKVLTSAKERKAANKSISRILVFGMLPALYLDSIAFADGISGELPVELSPFEVVSQRKEIVEDLPGSVVFTPTDIQNTGIEHLQDITRYIPDLTYVTGSSRPRFYLMRGIGELDQYEDHVSASVSYYVDDIDLTGLAAGSLLFDVDSVIVQHGPSGSMGGGGGFAGSIDVRGAAPGETVNGKGQISLADYGTASGSIAFGTALTKDRNLRLRFSLSKYLSDGFIENKTLDRRDTQNYDELASRVRLEWEPTDTLSAALSLLYIDQDDGYDAFNYDYNSKSKTTDGLTTLSDMPGKDEQRIKGASLRFDWKNEAPFSITSITSGALIDTNYWFDEDWLPGGGINGYTHDRYYVSQEIRLSSLPGKGIGGNTDWSTGIYYKHDDDDAEKTHSGYKTDQKTDRIALYGNMRHGLSKEWSLAWGVRGEAYLVDFGDNSGNAYSPSDLLASYFAGVEYTPDSLKDWLFFSRVKFGQHGTGVNTDDVPAGVGKEYDRESLSVFEMGFEQSSFDGRWINNLTAFYQYRENPQIKRWEYNSSLGWIGYTVNGDRGQAWGLEGQSRFVIAPEMFSVFAVASLIKTQVWSDLIPTLDNGREQSHTPACQYSLGADVGGGEGFFGRAEVVGMTSFYFDNFDYAKSHPYALLNLRAGYRVNGWTVAVWVNNVFDRSYDTRGMDFDTDDPHSEVYLQRGDPRFVGMTVTYDF